MRQDVIKKAAFVVAMQLTMRLGEFLEVQTWAGQLTSRTARMADAAVAWGSGLRANRPWNLSATSGCDHGQGWFERVQRWTPAADPPAGEKRRR